jgi:hypothetical protein
MSTLETIPESNLTYTDFAALHYDLLTSFNELNLLYDALKPDLSPLALSVKSLVYSAIESVRAASLNIESSIPPDYISFT